MGFGDRFINLFILADPTKEIPLGYFWGCVLVIGISRGDLQSHVCGNDGWVVAQGLEKNQRKPLLLRDARFKASSELRRDELTTLTPYIMHGNTYLRLRVLFVASTNTMSTSWTE